MLSKISSKLALDAALFAMPQADLAKIVEYLEATPPAGYDKLHQLNNSKFLDLVAQIKAYRDGAGGNDEYIANASRRLSEALASWFEAKFKLDETRPLNHKSNVLVTAILQLWSYQENMKKLKEQGNYYADAEVFYQQAFRKIMRSLEELFRCLAPAEFGKIYFNMLKLVVAVLRDHGELTLAELIEEKLNQICTMFSSHPQSEHLVHELISFDPVVVIEIVRTQTWEQLAQSFAERYGSWNCP